MTGRDKQSFTNTLVPRVLKLAAVEFVALLVIGATAYTIQGPQGLVVAVVAASVCWLGAMAGLVVITRPADPSQALARVYAAMGLRSAIPMMLGLTAQQMFPQLAAAGLMIYIVPFYLVTLASETLFAVGEFRPRLMSSKATSASSS